MSTPKPTFDGLVIDHNAEDRQFLRSSLFQSNRSEFKLDFYDCVKQCESALRESSLDLVLLGADTTGDDTLDQITRFRAIDPSLAVIVLANRFDSATAAQCIARGAQDCLPKHDLSPASLRRSIHLAVQRQRVVGRLTDRHESLAAELARNDERRQQNHRFLRAVSHDFRTPLTVITEYASLMNDGLVGQSPLDEKQQQFLSVIGDRADELNTMVDNLLDATKLESNCLPLWRKRFQLHDAIFAIETNLRNKAAVKDVELVIDVDTDLPEVFADDEQVQRALNNIISCAIQTSGSGGRVHVQADVDAGKKDLAITVCNTQSDFDADEEANLFQSLSQNGPCGDCRGVGLSLSVAKELAQLNLGDLQRIIVPEQGTRVTLTIPLVEAREIASRFEQRLEDDTTLTVVEVRNDDTSRDCVDKIDALLNLILQPNDLLIQDRANHWLLLIPHGPESVSAEESIASYLERSIEMLRDFNQRRGDQKLPSSLDFTLLSGLPNQRGEPSPSAPWLVGETASVNAIEGVSSGCAI